LTDYYAQQGVDVRPGDVVSDMEQSVDGLYLVTTGSGAVLEADAVVAGIGIQPNVELAESAGLEVDNGILVDEHLLTSAPDVYAAGDVASFYSPILGKRLRVEHEDTPTRWALQPGATWRASTSRITTCLSSTRTCSTSAMRRSAS